MHMNFVAMDFETANHQSHSACSLALVMVQNSQIVDEYYTLIQPETPFFWRNVQIHGIHQEDVRTAPKFPEVWQTCRDFTLSRKTLWNRSFEKISYPKMSY